MPGPGLQDHPEDRPYSPGEGKPRTSGGALRKRIPHQDPGNSLLSLLPIVGRKCTPKSSLHPPCCTHPEPTSLPLEAQSPGTLKPPTLAISLLPCSRPWLDPQAFPGRVSGSFPDTCQLTALPSQLLTFWCSFSTGAREPAAGGWTHVTSNEATQQGG